MKGKITIEFDVADGQVMHDVYKDIISDLGVRNGKDTNAIEGITYKTSKLELSNEN